MCGVVFWKASEPSWVRIASRQGQLTIENQNLSEMRAGVLMVVEEMGDELHPGIWIEQINVLVMWNPDLSLSAKGIKNVEKEKTRMNPVALIGIVYVSVKS